MSEINDYFPYTEIFDYEKLLNIKGGFKSISPPSNWGDKASEFTGFYVTTELYLTFSLTDKTILKLHVKPNIHYFVNGKESKLYFVPGSFDKCS